MFLKDRLSKYTDELPSISSLFNVSTEHTTISSIYLEPSVPPACDVIEVLWIVNNRDPFRWKLTVLEISNIYKGTTRSRALLRYGPRPVVDKVYLFSEITGDIDNKNASTALRNTWRMFEPTEKHYANDFDWLSQSEGWRKKPDTNCNNPKSVMSKLDQENHNLVSTLTTLPAGMNSAGPSKYQEHLALKNQIFDWIRRIEILETGNRKRFSTFTITTPK